MPEAAGTAQIPHGIMGLQPIPTPWMSYGVAGCVLLLVALILWFFWKRFRRRSATLASRVTTVPPMDPWTQVSAKFAALDVREPWNRETCEEFFFQLSFVLREALELRTSLPITGQTLAETKSCLTKNPALSANFQQDLLNFLSLSEQLKFAGQWISASESREWRDKVKEWLEELRRGAHS